MHMSQHRQQYQMGVVGADENNGSQFVDKTFTKIFVGGLAWETQRESLGNYFLQFGEILEAVVITDKLTGKSKGYGFVTFKDADSAMRACQDPYPVIDGRRANCNIASLGSQRTPPFAHQHGMQRFRPASGSHHQPSPQYSLPYPSFSRYSSYPPQGMYSMNYYNAEQQLSSYYANAAASGSPGFYYNYYPFHPQYVQNSSTQGFRIHQYPQAMHYPYLPQYLPQQYTGIGVFSVPTSPSSAADAFTAGAATVASAESDQQTSSA